MRIVVTGATSMIGVALIEKAVANKVEVLAMVNKNSTRTKRLPKSDLVTIAFCDLNDVGSVSFEEKEYDSFYHFAWKGTDKGGRNSPLVQAENITSTIEMVKLAKRLGCKRFIGAGSQAEYGQAVGVISPDTITNPQTAYGIAKLTSGKLAELMCRQLDIEFVWGRIFSVYGCLDNEGTMVNYAIDRFLLKEEARFSSAMNYWNYLNERDAGEAFFLLGKCENVSGVYCIANNESKILREYIQTIADCFGTEAKCCFSESSTGTNLIADISKLEKDTGFIPRVGFREGISSVIEFRRKGLERK